MKCSCGASDHVACGTLRRGEVLILTTPMEADLYYETTEPTIEALRQVVEAQGKLIESLLALIADRGFEREAKKLLARV